ncbi:mechanosensitive ion channel family protein [Ferrimonas gelatinilytica]|uniref:Mechanosensitive ion channel n=1 Tax=Ferrimonas gelatinilytica TaxID=1255257 RepID=A0ABP9RU28_9GAMM
MEQELRSEMRSVLVDWLANWGLPVQSNDLLQLVILSGMGLALALLVYLVAVHLVGRAMKGLLDRSGNEWAVEIRRYRSVEKLLEPVPLVVLDLFTPLVLGQWPAWQSGVTKTLEAVMVLSVARFLFSLLDVALAVASGRPLSRRLPVHSMVQLAKLFLSLISAIILFAILLDKSPLYLLSGLGVATGLLLLVFRDTILGFVAGIQLSANRMVSRGDWIQMDQYGADGEVLEVNINTVKVQNWDKTISMIPAHAMVSDAFKNWQGMMASGGRRIKRALLLDLNSVGFADEAMVERLMEIDLLAPHIERKRRELSQANATLSRPERLANGRRLTNVGCFRAYLQAYLEAHPRVHKEMTLMVRQLAPNEHGLPMEIYCFTNDTRWTEYEGIQADIFDHALAVLPEFGLRPMQQPTGADVRALAQSVRPGETA